MANLEDADLVNYVRFLGDEPGSLPADLGGKGYSLDVLTRRKFRIPEGFVVTLNAFLAFIALNHSADLVEEFLSRTDCRNDILEAEKAIVSGEVPPEMIREISEALSELDAECLAIRSSAAMEDSLCGSFAGAYETLLSICSETGAVLESIKKCWASLFGQRALAYRIRKQLPPPAGMAVVIQEMIPAEVSGITLTKNPKDETSLLIEATYGLGKAVTNGLVEPDCYTVHRDTLRILHKTIGRKQHMQVCGKGFVEHVTVPAAEARQHSLTDTSVLDVTRTCLSVEKCFGTPQDIEWSILDKRLWILQSRPICQ